LILSTMKMINRRRPLIHAMMLVLTLIPFIVLFAGIGGGAIQTMGRDSSLTGRKDIWPRVIALVDNPVIGTGFESFWLGDRLRVMQEYQLALNEAHNGYLEVWICLGWIGVLILGVLIVKGYRNITALYYRDPTAGSFRMAIFLTVIVSSFTEAALRSNSLSWVVFLLMTLSIPESQPVEFSRAPRIREDGPRRRYEPVSPAVPTRTPVSRLTRFSGLLSYRERAVSH